MIDAKPLLALLVAVGIAPTVAAQVPATPEAAHRAALDNLGALIDVDRDGRMTRREVDVAAGVVFRSMDADDDGRVTRDEMTRWDLGVAALASGAAGRTVPVDAIVGEVFDRLDVDRSGTLSADEHAAAMAQAAAAADRDGDGAMSRAEFETGFLLSAVLRAVFLE